MQIADAARVVGTTKRTIHSWLERDQIPWLTHARTGSQGKPADFDELDLLRLRLMVIMTEYGASIREAADSVWWLMPDGSSFSDDDRAVILDVKPDIESRIVCWRDDQGEWKDMILDVTRPKPDEAISGRIRRQRTEAKIIPPAALVIDHIKLFRDVRERIAALESDRAA